jgi:hypothetical protein
MRFWLGVHGAHWLSKTVAPLFVSRRRLADRRTLPRAQGPWALDSGAFTELRLHGRFTISAAQYAVEIARYAAEIGQLAWAAPQDWMCEPFMLATTQQSVAVHQARTIQNFLDLRTRTPLVIPVLQGWHLADYLRHVDQYGQAGVDLIREPIVGIGSVCRRQDMVTGARIVEALWALGLRLHGFGVKLTGLARFAHLLTSADSMAWSYEARRRRVRRPTCLHRAESCRNCLTYALEWATRIDHRIETPKQWPLGFIEL